MKCKLCNKELEEWIQVRNTETKRLVGYFCNEKHAIQYNKIVMEIKEVKGGSL